MKRSIPVGLLCALTIAGCSGEHPMGSRTAPDSTRAIDSVRAADSTAVPASMQALAALTYEERQGAAVYGKYCAVCHGAEGKGDGFNAFNLDPRPRDLSDSAAMKSLSDDQILQTITGGGRSVNKSPLMPSYGWTLDSPRIRYVAAFVRTFSRKM